MHLYTRIGFVQICAQIMLNIASSTCSSVLGFVTNIFFQNYVVHL